jgi:norsolorinic acid ketoreductase
VIAANRDPSHPTSQAPADLPKNSGSNLIVVKYDAGVKGAAFDAVKQAQEEGITRLDIVIAKLYPLVKNAKRSDLLEHYHVNVIGPVELYHATRDLQGKSGKPLFDSGVRCGCS